MAEKSDELPPMKVPIPSEDSITMDALEGNKPCVFEEMFLEELNCMAVDGVLKYSDICTAATSMGQKLMRMGHQKDISSILKNCEEIGIITPIRIAGWKLNVPAHKSFR